VKVSIISEQIGHQAVIERVVGGDVVLSTVQMTSKERGEATDKLFERLEGLLARMEERELSETDREVLLRAARELLEGREADDQVELESRISRFLETFKNCFGSTAEVITTAVNLARVLAGAA